MDETTFQEQAARTLDGFFDRIDEVLGDVVEADMDGGILTLELDDGGHYVINRHAPNRQIWMSSPKSGASHYGWDEGAGAWLDTRDRTDLCARLAAELSAATGIAVTLDP